jgi:putative transposase
LVTLRPAPNRPQTNSNHRPPVFDNLVQRQFDIPKIDQVYAADVTYIWTQEG